MLLGEPMGFWKRHMPRGMFLRSACDWHYDPFDEDTIERWVETKGLRTQDVEPLAIDFYLGYPEWFQQRKQIAPVSARVTSLDHLDDSPGAFVPLSRTADRSRRPTWLWRSGFALHERARALFRAVSTGQGRPHL